jgi:YidC/Oxa1 family membrane protein insertase
MEKKPTSGGQIFQVLALSLGMMLLWQMYFGPKNQNSQVEPRKAPALVKAFAGIDPAQGPALQKEPARDEIEKLEKEIAKNEKDDVALWSKLRVALIKQYVLGNLETKERASGMLGFGPQVKYFPAYDEIIHAGSADEAALAIEAQATYQSGDLLWRQSTKNGAPPSQSATTILESLVHKGRGSSAFLDQKIFVPKEVDPAKVPIEGPPPTGFKEVQIRQLRGTVDNPNPQGILDRVNSYYAATSNFYKVFDTAVKALGDNRAFSYGLAILLFAITTRVVMQPIYKRQYDSMKGMALIAPEMKKVQEKYKGKTDQASQMAQMKEIRALQQRHGVNPLIGCGLALLQMPIFFLFVYPLIQHYEPKMELVEASFLWISSLSRSDIPLLILYGISMFFSFRLSATPPTDDMQRQQQMIMSFMFPIIFPLFLIAYPSAFTMYWMTYNAVSTIFQWRMVKAADPSKTLMKALMGTGLKPVEATDDAVPSRPKSEKKVVTHTVPKSETNGSADSVANNSGQPNKAAENGSVLKPVAKKKK